MVRSPVNSTLTLIGNYINGFRHAQCLRASHTPETQSWHWGISYADEHQIEVVRQTSRQAGGQTDRRTGTKIARGTHSNSDCDSDSISDWVTDGPCHLMLMLWHLSWAYDYENKTKLDYRQCSISRYTECGYTHPQSQSQSQSQSPSRFPFPPSSLPICSGLFNKWLTLRLGPNSLGVCIRWRVVSPPICIIRLQAAATIICQSVSI